VTPLMIKLNMASQWDLGNFKPLDMSIIPGCPRRIPLRYVKWLPKFTSSDEENDKDHMHEFYSFFQLQPINDDVEYLAMKLFSVSLHDNARRWYDGLPDASITSMDQLEEVFLKIWNIKEDPIVFLNKLNYIKKAENETVREFHDRFDKLIQHIPASHHPSNNFFIFLYTTNFT
jgi:hypothetical protein